MAVDINTKHKDNVIWNYFIIILIMLKMLTDNAYILHFIKVAIKHAVYLMRLASAVKTIISNKKIFHQ